MVSSVISKNSEILFLYEAKLTNPNGDPDDENRPRMDPKTRRNLVSDVRLKRYFRDYAASKLGEDHVWVVKPGGRTVDATERFDQFGRDPGRVLSECIDARLFGATFPLKPEEAGRKKGQSIAYTGPVQFSWGISLHPVDLVDSRSITSEFSGAQAGYGTIGKDYRVYYSLIAFYGAVSARRARDTGATEEDLMRLDDWLWDALVTETVTRSKIGQRPLLYLRAEYGRPEDMMGDLRRFIAVDWDEPVRDISNVRPELSGLASRLKAADAVYLRCADDFGACGQLRGQLETSKVRSLPHGERNSR
jgi:CRISPR-associated protein Csh2